MSCGCTNRVGCAILALGALAIVGANEVRALGTPTYIIYVNGPNGGTIEASGGAIPLPDGACGMRVTSDLVLEWSWYSGDVWPIDVMDVENNGWQPPPDELMVLLEFTGEFGSGCAGSHVFHTPATPSSEPPPGAVALVVQFIDPQHVEFLDWNFGEFEPPEIPDHEDPPDLDDICEDVPEFCEIPGPGDLVQDPCFKWKWTGICNTGEELGRLGLGIGHIVEPRVLGLSALTGGSSDAAALNAALVRVSKAAALTDQANRAREAFVRDASVLVRHPGSIKRLSRVAVAADLGERGIDRCRQSIEEALRVVRGASTSPGRQRLLGRGRRARAVCDAASRTLADAHAEATLFTVVLRNER
jgi:hypothetical protein